MDQLINFYLKQDKVIFWINTLTTLIGVLIIVLWQLNLQSLPFRLPLFYSLPWGEPQLAGSNQFIIIPFLIFLVTLFNLAISWYLHPSQYPLKRIISASSLVFAVLMFIASFRIIYLFL